MKEKEFIPYEQSLELKELGFNEPCFAYRDGGGYLMIQQTPHCVISAPTFSQAFRWFRERYQLHSYIEGAYPWFRYYINSKDDRWEGHKTLVYEEAELACLKQLITFLQKQVK